jgi:LysM repeat protein
LYSSIENTLSLLNTQSNQDSLHIPVKKYTELRTQKDEESRSNEHSETGTSGKKVYTVKKGDTLSEIAQKHKTTVSKLKKLNNLKSDKLQIGQKLKLK